MGVERADQGRAQNKIGLGWVEQSKDNQRRAYLEDKIEARRLYQIGLDHIKQIG